MPHSVYQGIIYVEIDVDDCNHLPWLTYMSSGVMERMMEKVIFYLLGSQVTLTEKERTEKEEIGEKGVAFERGSYGNIFFVWIVYCYYEP